MAMAMANPHFHAEKDAIRQQGDVYIIRPRGLNIVWGNLERYWKLPKQVSNGDDEPVELIQVSWLEVTGSVCLKPNKKYKLSFEVELAPDAFGWSDIQVFVIAKVGQKGNYKWTRVKLGQDSTAGKFKIPDITTAQPLIIETPADQNADTTLHFGLYEVWSRKWKGGLKIYQANIMEWEYSQCFLCHGVIP